MFEFSSMFRCCCCRLFLCALITCDVQTTTISSENRLQKLWCNMWEYNCACVLWPVPTRPDQFMLRILYSRVTVSHSRSFWHLDNVHATEKQTISQKVHELSDRGSGRCVMWITVSCIQIMTGIFHGCVQWCALIVEQIRKNLLYWNFSHEKVINAPALVHCTIFSHFVFFSLLAIHFQSI